MTDTRFKFRAYIPEAKYLRDEAKEGMFYQEDQYLSSFIRRIYDQYGVNHPSQLPFELEDRLMQSTGLKDKNRKLIYGGDIVKNVNSDSDAFNDISLVNYHQEGIGGFTVLFEAIGQVKMVGTYEHLEIIGNKYENSEPLEKKKRRPNKKSKIPVLSYNERV